MFRFRLVPIGVIVALLLASVQVNRGEAPSPPGSSGRVDQPVKPALAQALREALKSEKDAYVRLLLAKALIRIAPEDTTAASELVKALTEGEKVADAYIMMEELIRSAPPALVKALLPVLKDGEEINRRRAAALLSGIDSRSLP